MDNQRGIRLARTVRMLYFFRAGPDMVRWELVQVDDGYRLTVYHRMGTIREYFKTTTAALLREQELEDLLTTARGFAAEEPAAACPRFES